VWVAAQDAGLLVRVDPATRKVVHEVDVGQGVRLVVPGPDALWLDDQPGGTVVRVDPQTYEVRRSDHVCDGPEDLAVIGSTVWVTCSSGDEVVALGADDLRPTRRVALTGTPDAVTVAPDGSMLVALQDGPTLVRLDSSTGAEIGRTRLGKQPQLYDRANLDVTVTGEYAWVTSYADDSVFRTPWRR
jgi:DNA-binding beta-propeller fold protein YncE